MTVHRFDPNLRAISTIGTIPVGDQVATGSYILGAGSTVCFEVTTTPPDGTLSVWNFLWSVYIDTNDDTANYPINVSDAIRKNILITDHVDWADSSDSINTRVHYILIVNNDSVAHTIFLSYKAYTISRATGS